MSDLRAAQEVWLITAQAVYDHGCFGVFSTREKAEQHALDLWNESDGHHGFRIERVVVDEPKLDSWGLLEGWGSPTYRDRRRHAVEERHGGPWKP